MATATADGGFTPVTVIAGPDDAGKVALVRHLLTDPAMARAALLVAEDIPGVASLPAAQTLRQTEEPATGCLCCAVQGDLRRALRTLLARARRGDVARVVLVLAASADPATVLATLASDPAIAAVFRAGGIVMLPGAATLGDDAIRQARLADRFVIPATGAPKALLDRLRDLNPSAPVARHPPPPGFVLEVRAIRTGPRHAEAVTPPAATG